MPSVTEITVRKVNHGAAIDAIDWLASEEPLELRLVYWDGDTRVEKNISVTMRTPGADFELAAGFLYTEGIIAGSDDIEGIEYIKKDNENIVRITLNRDVMFNTDVLERHFYTTSSCGVCGKASIEAVRVACNIPDVPDNLRVTATTLLGLPGLLRASQPVFESTGGLHGCALFNMSGLPLLSREDVGRHNALDKLIGAALLSKLLPLNQHILLLSGRASFELVQKSVMAGIKIIAAVGAPSSLAAEMAEEWGITLAGFLRGQRFNIYSGAERIVI